MLKIRIKYRLLVFVILSAFFFLAIPSSTGKAQEKKGTDNKKTDKEKLEISVDVNYFLLDVIALDKDGKHIADLTKNDFELFIDGKPVPIATLDIFSYGGSGSISEIGNFQVQRPQSELVDVKNDFILDENGFQNELSAYDADSLSIGSQPPRTFAIVFANLPMLPARWNILKEGLIDYIKNYLSNDAQIAVFSMGMSDLGIILPFTRDKEQVIKTINMYLGSRWKSEEEEKYDNEDTKKTFDLDEKSDNFYIMADSPSPDLDHRTSSWLISGFDTITIQQNTVYALFKQFDIIINKLSEIPGRKNLLLFSEGFPYVAETMSEYIRTRDRMRLLISRMNKFNISLYTFDMFTSRNLQASAVRGGLLADLSSSTNGVFFKWLGNSKTKIARSLVQTDILTSCYYLVGFYLNGIKIEDDSKAELRINREDAQLIYNEWLNGKKNFSTERYLKKMESSRRLISNKSFEDISDSLVFHFLPGIEGKTWVVISEMFPASAVIEKIPDENEKNVPKKSTDDLDAELLIKIESKTRKEMHYALKKMEVENEKLTDQLIYNYRILLDPGLYKIKTVLQSLNNQRAASDENEITVPDFHFDSDSHTIIIADEKKSSLTIQNPLQMNEKTKLRMDDYPFYPEGEILFPAHIPVYKPTEIVTFYIYCNRSVEDTSTTKLALISEDGETIPIENLTYSPAQMFLEDFKIFKGEFSVPKIKAGKYRLHSKLRDSDKAGSETDLIIQD